MAPFGFSDAISKVSGAVSKAADSLPDIPDALSSPIEIPGLACGSGGHYNLHYEIGIGLKNVILKCSDGSEQINLSEKASDLTSEAKAETQRVAKLIADRVGNISEHVPKNIDDIRSMAKDAAHPVTATILSGLVLLASEFSGFGVYALVTTIMGTLILTPGGWFLSLAVVYVMFAYRKKLKSEDLSNVKEQLRVLDQKVEDDEMAREEYRNRVNSLIEDHFE